MRDMHDGSFSPDCVDCLKYEKSQLEAELREQKALTEEVHTKLDALSGQLDTALTDRTVERDRVASLHRANSDLRAENARRRNENKGLEVTLQDCREEIQQRNEEIAELKRARLYSIPTTYIVGADPSDPVWSRMKLLEEENARLQKDNEELYRAAKRATTVREDTSSLRGQLAKADAKVVELTEENARLEADNAKLEDKIMSLQDALDYADVALGKARKERDEVCDYRVHDLEALNEQTSISLEHVRQDLFDAQAKLMAIRNAVK